MSFPSLSEYQTAIQNTELVLKDKRLKKMSPRLNPLGLPVVMSGGFSLTFLLEDEEDIFVLKCFTQSVPNLEERYKAIDEFMNTHRLSGFVNYDFQVESVFIRENWWPALKMDYAEGQPLNLFVEQHLHEPDLLKELDENFCDLLLALERDGVAHGDLQHGNVLVKPNGTLTFVDYDGMFTPNMEFDESNEIGHENYQHPARQRTDFNDTLDRFSAAVIDISLYALAAKPELWDTYYNGENLILTRQDFEHPEESKVLSEMADISSELERMVENFKKMCVSPFSNLPLFSVWLDEDWVFPESKDRIFIGDLRERKLSQYKVIEAKEKRRLLASVSKVVTVYGYVKQVYHGYTKYKKPFVFLQFGSWKKRDFTITIWSEGLEYLDAKGINVDDYEHCFVSFTALLENYRGKPNQIFSEEKANKINILDDEEIRALEYQRALWEDEESKYVLDIWRHLSIRSSIEKSDNEIVLDAINSESYKAEDLQHNITGVESPYSNTEESSSSESDQISGGIYFGPGFLVGLVLLMISLAIGLYGYFEEMLEGWDLFYYILGSEIKFFWSIVFLILLMLISLYD